MKTKTIEIKKVDVMSVGKIYGVIGAIIGAILGVFVFLAALAGAAVMPGAKAAMSIVVAFVVAIVATVGYALILFISGLIIAAIYNYAAKKIGGIKFEY